MEWFQLKANIPYVGEQLAGWIYTDRTRATALHYALQSCPGAPYRILTQAGQPLVAQQPTLPGGGGWTSPGWPRIPGLS